MTSSQYIIREDVPLLDEHKLLDKDGKVVEVIDEKFLQEVADNNNRRIAETGDLTPIVIGHTEDGVSEKAQPEIVGYAYKFRVGPLFNTGRKTILSSCKFLADKKDLINKHPRRSVELWFSRKQIDPISLLGATSPERDLGLLRLSRSDESFHYSRLSPEESMSNSKPSDIAKEVVEMLKQSDVWKWAESQMKASGANPPEEGDDLTPPGDGDDLDFNPDELPADEGDDPHRQYAAGMPGGSNTFIPGMERQKMSRDSDRIRLARAESLAALQAQELATLKIRFQREQREKDLIQLEAEGYILDRVEELDSVQEMSDERYQKHLSNIRRRYQKAPVNADLKRFSRPVPGVPGAPASLTREQAQTIAEKAIASGISFDQALAQHRTPGNATPVL